MMSKKSEHNTYQVKGKTVTIVDDPDVNRMVAAYLLRQKFKSNQLIN